MGSHSVTCHPTQANTPRLYPSQTGWYSIYRPFKDGGLTKPRPRVQRATGPRLLGDHLRPARLEPRPSDRKSSTLTTRLSRLPCAVHVASLIVILSDSMSSFIPSNHLLTIMSLVKPNREPLLNDCIPLSVSSGYPLYFPETSHFK